MFSPFFTISFLCLLNSPEVVIGWEMTLYSVSEPAGQVEICTVIFSGVLQSTIPTINVVFVDGSAAAGNTSLVYLSE